jgi:predicted site-specific integrase-resolvase
MARLYLRPQEAVRALHISRMSLFKWAREGTIQRRVIRPRKIYYIVNADVTDDGAFINLKLVRGRINGAGKKR